MKSVSIFLIGFINILNVAFSQESIEIMNAGNTGQDHGRALYKDDLGFFYQLGGSNGTTNVYGTTLTTPSPGSSYTWLVKLDSDLNVIWARTFKYYYSGIAQTDNHRIVCDENRNIYITDQHNSTVTIDGFTVPGSGSFTVKLDSLGSPIWIRNFGGRDMYYIDGHLELFNVHSNTGNINGQSITNEKGVVLRIDTDGNYINHFQFDLPVYSIERVMGRMNNGNYYGFRKISNSGAQSNFMFITDPSGNMIYNKRINNNSFPDIIDVDYDENSNDFVAISVFGDQHPFDSIQYSYPPLQLKVIRLDSLFNLTHLTDLGPNATTISAVYSGEMYIDIAEDGSVYVLGFRSNPTTNEAWTHFGFTNPFSATEDQLVFAKLGKQLDFKWVKVLPSTYYSQFFGNIITKGHDIYLSGNTTAFTSDINFNSFGSTDAFIYHVRDNDSSNMIISGKVYTDINNNGLIDINESGRPYYGIEDVESGIVSYTNGLGNFDISGEYGSNTVQTLNVPQFHIPSTPSPVFHTFNSIDSTINNVDFGIHPLPDIIDLSVDIAHVEEFRTGFRTKTIITFKNQGSDTLMSGHLRLMRSPYVQMISSSLTPSFISSDSIEWQFTNLLPLETRSFFIIDSTLNLIQNLGLNVSEEISIFPLQDTVPQNNTDYLYSTIVGSFDPNDKQSDVCVITPSFYDNESSIEFMVRFQNTGSYYAQNILIVDTLSNLLDFNSLEMIYSSHYVELSRNENVLSFLFKDIMLPTSLESFENSKGFIKFKIKPLAPFNEANIISNKVDIIFDFNPPVTTNSVIINSVLDENLVSVDIIQPQCSNNFIGGISLTPICESLPLKYSINGSTFSSNSQFNNLISGFYNLKILYLGDTISLNLIELDTIQIPYEIDSINIQNASCSNSNDGQIEVFSSTANIEAGINGVFESDLLLENLSSGYYFVNYQVDGCELDRIDTVLISAPIPLNVSFDMHLPSGDSCLGSISVIVDGGITPYSFQWDQVVNQPNASFNDNLCPGTYCVQVSDNNGCIVDYCGDSALVQIFVEQPIVNNDTLNYCKNDFAAPLNAIGLSGNTVLWQDENGDYVSTIVPSTAVAGITSFNLIQVDANGNYSTPFPIVVIVHEQPIAIASILSYNGFDVQFDNSSQNSDSFLWNFGDGMTSNLTNPNHTYSISIQYQAYLVAMNSGCPNDTTYFEVSFNLGLDNPTFSELMVYPNPTNELINVKDVHLDLDQLTIEIYDFQGELVSQLTKDEFEFSNEVVSLSVNYLSSGIYYLVLTDMTKTRRTSKFVVQH